MRALFACLLLASACGGPSQKALAETPTATTKRTPVEAPAASTSDADREQLIQSSDEMLDAANAHREARNPPPETPAPKPAPKPAQPKTEPAQPEKK